MNKNIWLGLSLLVIIVVVLVSGYVSDSEKIDHASGLRIEEIEVRNPTFPGIWDSRTWKIYNPTTLTGAEGYYIVLNFSEPEKVRHLTVDIRGTLYPGETFDLDDYSKIDQIYTNPFYWKENISLFIPYNGMAIITIYMERCQKMPLHKKIAVHLEI